VSWPATQTISVLRPHFTVSATRALPSSVSVTYWNGRELVPVKNLSVTLAGASNQPSAVTFDPVNTTQIRMQMTSPAPGTNAGFFQITELFAEGVQIEPSLIDLKVAGRSVDGFDPSRTTYGPIPVQYDAVPLITGVPAGDETVSVALPASLPGAATVTVTSGDASRVYTVQLIPADIDQGTVGGTVPPTLSLTLGGPVTFGTFVPGVARDYVASTSANVTSTAGDATLSVSGDRLRNGAFELAQPLQTQITPAAWSGPVSNAPVAIRFTQSIGANEPLRTGTYSSVLTFTLSTTSP
jgi:hypothetical protein